MNMKALRKLLYILPLAGLLASTSCTDIENIEVEHIGGYNTMNDTESEEYYANLRAYKLQAVNYGRPVAFGWFSIGLLPEHIAEGISLPCPTVLTSFPCGAAHLTVLTLPPSKKQTRSLFRK